MSCYHPLKAFRTPDGVVFNELARHDIIGSIELPCGKCIGCRMRRASEWELRVMHEAQVHAESSFVTLTYAPGNLPAFGSLEHRDFQLFMKRARKRLGPLRFFMCGEYGDLNRRPHYHACLFGAAFRSDRVPGGKSGSGSVFYKSAVLEDLWQLGQCSVQDLVRETASYCARYIMKKVTGDLAEKHYEVVCPDTGEIGRLKPEYCAMSLKPGIGEAWFRAYGEGDVYRHDYVIADGVKRQTPRYYDKLLMRKDKACGKTRIDDVQYKRGQKAAVFVEDNTPERREVREQVHLARVRNLKRDI